MEKISECSYNTISVVWSQRERSFPWVWWYVRSNICIFCMMGERRRANDQDVKGSWLGCLPQAIWSVDGDDGGASGLCDGLDFIHNHLKSCAFFSRVIPNQAAMQQYGMQSGNIFSKYIHILDLFNSFRFQDVSNATIYCQTLIALEKVMTLPWTAAVLLV